MGQEWRLYDVGGTRSSVSIFPFQSFTPESCPDCGDSGQHGIPTLTMVSVCSLVIPLPNADPYSS
jgi:hypothetical protein